MYLYILLKNLFIRDREFQKEEEIEKGKDTETSAALLQHFWNFLPADRDQGLEPVSLHVETRCTTTWLIFEYSKWGWHQINLYDTRLDSIIIIFFLPQTYSDTLYFTPWHSKHLWFTSQLVLNSFCVTRATLFYYNKWGVNWKLVLWVRLWSIRSWFQYQTLHLPEW